MITGFMALTLIQLGLGLTGSILDTIANQKLSKLANDLVRAAKENSALRDQLIEAYNMKDAKLANDIMMASPIGPALRKLRVDKNKLDKEYKEKKAKYDKRQEQLETAASDVENRKYLGQSGTGVTEAGKLISVSQGLKGKSSDENSNKLADYNQLLSGGIK